MFNPELLIYCNKEDKYYINEKLIGGEKIL
jgi:hypothetical protein